MFNSDVLTISFSHTNTTRQRGKEFTTYEIDIKSASTIKWVIYKRFSEFDSFHTELIKSLTIPINSITATTAGSLSYTSAELLKNRLPVLPPKRAAFSLNEEFVEKRRLELEKYLIAMVAISELFEHIILLKFLAVPDSVRPMLLDAAAVKNKLNSTNKLNNPSGYSIESLLTPTESKQLASKPYEERRVIELVTILKNSNTTVNTSNNAAAAAANTAITHRVAALTAFEDYFFDSRPRISSELIRLLFQGRSGLDNDGGLIQCCGSINSSRVASRAALDLLVRLLDVETNKDAQLFIEQFVSLDLVVLKRMKLIEHILPLSGNNSNTNDNRLAAFRIVAIIQSAGPLNMNLSYLLDNPIALNQYNQWALRNATSNSSAAGLADITVNTVASKSLIISEDIGPKIIIQKSAEELIELIHSIDNNKLIQHQLAIEQSKYNSAQLKTSWRIVKSINTNDSNTSNNSSNNNNSTDINNIVSISYRKDIDKQITIVRLCIILPYSNLEVSNYLQSINNRRDWDPKYHSGRIVQQFNLNTATGLNLTTAPDIVQIAFKSFTSPYKYRDLVCIRAIQAIKSGNNNSNYLHIYRSILHSSAPEQKDTNRGVLFSSGYYIESIENQQWTTVDSKSNTVGSESTQLTVIYQFDSESVLIMTPDLLGESNELQRSIINIKLLLAKQYGNRILKSSNHTKLLAGAAGINNIDESATIVNLDNPPTAATTSSRVSIAPPAVPIQSPSNRR